MSELSTLSRCTNCTKVHSTKHSKNGLCSMCASKEPSVISSEFDEKGDLLPLMRSESDLEDRKTDRRVILFLQKKRDAALDAEYERHERTVKQLSDLYQMVCDKLKDVELDKIQGLTDLQLAKLMTDTNDLEKMIKDTKKERRKLRSEMFTSAGRRKQFKDAYKVGAISRDQARQGVAATTIFCNCTDNKLNVDNHFV